MEKRKKAPKETICLRMNPQTIALLAVEAEVRGFSISKTAENYIISGMTTQLNPVVPETIKND